MTDAPALSATLVLAREAPSLEVLMVRRAANLAFGADALVFPGGRVDPSDGDRAWRAWAHGAEGLSAFDLALRVAAVREQFEETGVLLAAGASPSAAAPPGQFGAALAATGRRLDLTGLRTFARWITPRGLSRRFDTWFFTAPAPADCVPVCDGQEAVEAEWIAPGEALALADRGERKLMLPTRLNLVRLARLGGMAAIEAAADPSPPPVEPTIVERDGRRYLCSPAVGPYEAAEEALGA